MKKRVLAMLMAGTMLLAGCGASKQNNNENKPVAAGKTNIETAAASAEEIPAASVDDTSFTLDTDQAEIVDEEPEAGKYDEFISLADYKSMKIDAPAGVVIKEGMTANINYRGTVDGSAFDGSTGENFDLLVVSGSFLPGTGFEKQLIGKKAGEQFIIRINLPEDYWDSSLAGKEAEYKVTVNKIYYATPEEVLNQIVEGSQVKKYPKSLYDKWYSQTKAQYLSFKAPDQTLEEALATFGMDESSIESQAFVSAKNELVCQAIFDAEGITEEDPLYQEGLDAVLAQYAFKSLTDMKNAGYSDEEINNLVQNKVVYAVIRKYQN